MMTLTGRRLAIVAGLMFLLGGAASQGAATVVRAAQGGMDLGLAQEHAVEVAVRWDDQRLIEAASAARLALSSNDHRLFGVVALQARSYTDAVGMVRSSLGLMPNEQQPDWFYTCFASTAQAMRASAGIFESASGIAEWSGSQASTVQQTVDDLDALNQDVDLIATGGQSLAPKTPARPGPNGVFSTQATCQQIEGLSDGLAQRQWPS